MAAHHPRDRQAGRVRSGPGSRIRASTSAAESGLTAGERCREVLLKASSQPVSLTTPTEETPHGRLSSWVPDKSAHGRAKPGHGRGPHYRGGAEPRQQARE
jgi:hypothetical protein